MNASAKTKEREEPTKPFSCTCIGADTSDLEIVSCSSCTLGAVENNSGMVNFDKKYGIGLQR